MRCVCLARLCSLFSGKSRLDAARRGWWGCAASWELSWYPLTADGEPRASAELLNPIKPGSPCIPGAPGSGVDESRRHSREHSSIPQLPAWGKLGFAGDGASQGRECIIPSAGAGSPRHAAMNNSRGGCCRWEGNNSAQLLIQALESSGVTSGPAAPSSEGSLRVSSPVQHPGAPGPRSSSWTCWISHEVSFGSLQSISAWMEL